MHGNLSSRVTPSQRASLDVELYRASCDTTLNSVPLRRRACSLDASVPGVQRELSCLLPDHVHRGICRSRSSVSLPEKKMFCRRKNKDEQCLTGCEFRSYVERSSDCFSPHSCASVSSPVCVATQPLECFLMAEPPQHSTHHTQKRDDDTETQSINSPDSQLSHSFVSSSCSYQQSSSNGHPTSVVKSDVLDSLGSFRIIDIRKSATATQRSGSYADPAFPYCVNGPVDALKDALASLPQSTDRLRRLVFCFAEGLPEDVRGEVWRLLLDVKENGGPQLDSAVAEASALEPEQQRVIRNDVTRTRAHLPLFKSTETRKTMEAILAYICTAQHITYKQGLNEVLAPFYFISSPEFPIPLSVACFDRFLTRYLPYFHDDDFQALQCSFVLFQQLLTYHDPYLASYLACHHVLPELYVTPWFLTLFASKTQMNILLCFWDYYIAENDRLLCCFIALALLLQRRSIIFATDVSVLPETLAQIGFRTYAELHTVWNHAKVLKDHTPVSFNARNARTQARPSPSQATSSSVLRRCSLNFTAAPSYEFFYMLPREVLMSVKHCYGLTTPLLGKAGLTRPWKLFLLDVRPRTAFDTGHLPLAVSADLRVHDWKTRIRQLLPFVSATAVSSPIALLRLATGTHNDVEDHYDNAYQCHVCLMGEGYTTEDDGLLRQAYAFLVRDLCLPHVSVAQGGYRAAHALTEQLNLELIDHQKTQCALCASASEYADAQKQSDLRLRLWSFSRSNSSSVGTVPNGTVSASELRSRRSSFFFPSLSSASSALALVPSLVGKTKAAATRDSQDMSQSARAAGQPDKQHIRRGSMQCRSADSFCHFLLTRNPFQLITSPAPYLLTDKFEVIDQPLNLDVWRLISSFFITTPVSSFGTERVLVVPCHINAVALPSSCIADVNDKTPSCKGSIAYAVPTRQLCQLIASPKRIALATKMLPLRRATTEPFDAPPLLHNCPATTTAAEPAEDSARVVVEYAGFLVENLYKMILMKSEPQKAGFYFFPQPHHKPTLHLALTFLDPSAAFRVLRHIRSLYRSVTESSKSSQ